MTRHYTHPHQEPPRIGYNSCSLLQDSQIQCCRLTLIEPHPIQGFAQHMTYMSRMLAVKLLEQGCE